MEFLTNALGRFHPLVVHLPIGILILAFFFECVSIVRKYRRLEIAVAPSLFVGALSALLASATGWFLKEEGGYDEILVTRHLYLGISTTILALVMVILRSKLRNIVLDSAKRKRVNVFLSMVLIALLSSTGHFGGSLTHGDDYLTTAFKTSAPVDPMVEIGKIDNVDSAHVYSQIVQPLLSARCYSCHSSASQKGKLRLDSEEFILKGGKHGSALAGDIPDSTLLLKVLTLPIDDEHHMPPREKTQMSSTEIDFIGEWIGGGAPFKRKVAEMTNAKKLTALVHSMQYTSEKPWIPEEEVSPADPGIISQLQRMGVVVSPVSMNSNYLMLNYLNCDSVSQTLPLLQKIKPQAVWLQMSNADLTTKDLRSIGELKNLRALYLDNTNTTDEGIAGLSLLTDLLYLNLVNTKISNKAFDHFRQLRALKKLYVFGTSVSKKSIENYAKGAKDVVVNEGMYSLPAVATDTIVYRRKV